MMDFVLGIKHFLTKWTFCQLRIKRRDVVRLQIIMIDYGRNRQLGTDLPPDIRNHVSNFIRDLFEVRF